MTKNNFTEIVGLAAGICTAVSLLPQIIKIIKEKAAQDISLFYLLVLLCGLGLWTYYGFLKNDVPIIATNIFSMVLNIIVIILGSIYGRKRKEPMDFQSKDD
jgi:MtN3 and saliva related transmembrane protein